MEMTRRGLIGGIAALGTALGVPRRGSAAQTSSSQTGKRILRHRATMMGCLLGVGHRLGDAHALHVPLRDAIAEVTTEFMGHRTAAQNADTHLSTTRQYTRDGSRITIPNEYLSIPVTLDSRGNPDLDQVRRWSAMLNDLVDRGFWAHGVSLPTSVVRMGGTGGRYGLYCEDVLPLVGSGGRGVMFTFAFLDQDAMFPDLSPMDRPGPEGTGVKIGFPVAHYEGRTGDNDLSVWDRFPWK